MTTQSAADTRFKKGQKSGPGRPKGLENKVTKELKQMILDALDESGGVEYLKLQAIDNPGAFMTLIGKVLPTTLNGSGPDGAIKLFQRIENVIVDPTG